MQTLRALPVEFTFAGFNFPRYIADLPTLGNWMSGNSYGLTISETWQRRMTAMLGMLRKRRDSRAVCGPYYVSPTPNAKSRGIGFYATDDAGTLKMGDGGVNLRIEYVEGEYSAQDESFYAIIARLPKSRGFLAGWTMGPGMTSSLDCHAFDSLLDAQRAADNLAESAMWSHQQHTENQIQADNLRADIDALVDEVREKRELVQILVMARNQSKRDATTARLSKQIKSVRTDTHNIVDRVHVLRERFADNFARLGY